MNKKRKIVLLSFLPLIFSVANVEAAKGNPEVPPSHSKKMREKCHGQPDDVYKFAALLNSANQKQFCTSFNDAQKKQAMHLASQKDNAGNPKLTPDQAVEKVAGEK